MSQRESRDSLTGLRFFAALHVVVFHFGGEWFGGAPAWLRAIYTSGYCSVGLFFLLSGFVLAYNYLGPGGQLTTEARNFWSARLARIYPVYLLALVLMAPKIIPGSVAVNSGLMATVKLLVGGLSSLLLVQAWLPPASLYWNPQGWSVAVEAFFYAVFPLAAVWVGRLRRERLGLTLVALWGLGLLPSLLYLGLEPDGGPVDVLSRGPWLAVLKFNPLVRLPEFLMGVVLGRLFLQEQPASQRSGALMAPVGAALALGAFAASMHLPFALLHNALLAPVYALLVYGLARGGGPFGWVLSRRPLVLLGHASYSLYILQYPVWLGVGAVAEAVAPWVDFRGLRPLFVVYLGVMLGLSVLSHRWVETPMRGWVRRVLRPWVERRRRAPQVSPVGLMPPGA